jgi:hypothetical protein
VEREMERDDEEEEEEEEKKERERQRRSSSSSLVSLAIFPEIRFFLFVGSYFPALLSFLY